MSGYLPSRVSDDDINFVFRFADARSLKYLNTDGAHRALHALGWTALERNELTSMMQQMGKDPVNGLLDPNEFRTLVRTHMFSPDSKEDVDAAFQYFDQHRTGFITLDTLRSIGESVSGGPVSEQVLRSMLRIFDHDGDGRWDVNEFRSAVAPTLYPPPQKLRSVELRSSPEISSSTLPRRNSKSRESSAEAARRRSLSKESNNNNNNNTTTNSTKTTPRHSMERLMSSSSQSGFQRVGGSTTSVGRAPTQSNSQSRPSSARLSNSTRSTPRAEQPVTALPVSTNVVSLGDSKPVVDYFPIFYVGGAEFELDVQGTKASFASVKTSLRNLGYFPAPSGDEDFQSLFQSMDRLNEKALSQEQLFVLMSSLGAL